MRGNDGFPVGGLKAALEDLGTRCSLPVLVDAPGQRYAKQVEAATYFIVAEALANVAKHAHASRAEVKVEEQHRQLEIAVNDDGMGGANPDGGTGLRGLEDRIEALGGGEISHSECDGYRHDAPRVSPAGCERIVLLSAESNALRCTRTSEHSGIKDWSRQIVGNEWADEILPDRIYRALGRQIVPRIPSAGRGGGEAAAAGAAA